VAVFVSFGQVRECHWLKFEVKCSPCIIGEVYCVLQELFLKDVIKGLSFLLTDRHLLYW
jgi:hypothetical protein